MNWLAENWGTILISLILLGAVAGIAWRMIRNKKQGRTSCGCGCSGCAMDGACHRK